MLWSGKGIYFIRRSADHEPGVLTFLPKCCEQPQRFLAHCENHLRLVSAILLALLLLVLPVWQNAHVVIDQNHAVPLAQVQTGPSDFAVLSRMSLPEPMQVSRHDIGLTTGNSLDPSRALTKLGGPLSQALAVYHVNAALRCEQDSLRI